MRGFAFSSEVVRVWRQCVTWLSICQADLKVGVYETACGVYKRAVGLYERAGSLAIAARVARHSIDRHVKLALCFVRATLNAIAMRASACTSGYRFHTPRAFIQFGCGIAVGVILMLFLPLQSIPGATIPAPPALAPRASQALDVTLAPAVRPPIHAASVGAGFEQMVTTAGRREPDRTSVVPARPQPPSPRNPSSTPRVGSLKLAGYRGSLAVNSAPTGATVLVNGVAVGTTPLLLKDVPVGSRVVRLELDGYKGWSSAVRVVANQRVRTAVDLQPSPSNN
jgi:hypothetical protein